MTDSEPTDAADEAEQADARAAHDADRPPTHDEERAAEAAAQDVDPESGERYRDLAQRGAAVQGEGEVNPQ